MCVSAHVARKLITTMAVICCRRLTSRHRMLPERRRRRLGLRRVLEVRSSGGLRLGSRLHGQRRRIFMLHLGGRLGLSGRARCGNRTLILVILKRRLVELTRRLVLTRRRRANRRRRTTRTSILTAQRIVAGRSMLIPGLRGRERGLRCRIGEADFRFGVADG